LIPKEKAPSTGLKPMVGAFGLSGFVLLLLGSVDRFFPIFPSLGCKQRPETVEEGSVHGKEKEDKAVDKTCPVETLAFSFGFRKKGKKKSRGGRKNQGYKKREKTYFLHKNSSL
jgi:hypothetical protein